MQPTDEAAAEQARIEQVKQSTDVTLTCRSWVVPLSPSETPNAQSTGASNAIESLLQVRKEIAERTDTAYRQDPGFKRRPLLELNTEAAALYKVHTSCSVLL